METPNNTKEIDLGSYKGPKTTNFTGRSQGAAARRQIDLDKLDKDKSTSVILVIPEGTTSFNPSFYLGLLYVSYKTLGLDGFRKKYSFKLQSENPDTRKVIERNLDDGMRNAINALGNKNILSDFINS